MVLIYSSQHDESTNAVIDWLDFYQVKWVRINSIEFGKNFKFTFLFHNNTIERSLSHLLSEIDLSSITAVWLRRYSYASEIFVPENFDFNFITSVLAGVTKEKESVWGFMNRNCYPEDKWINHFSTVRLSKLKQLEAAVKFNINIPPTIVTTCKRELINFRKTFGNIIIKPIESFNPPELEGNRYVPFTQIVEDDFIQSLDENFHPMLCQKSIEKEFEIRTFFLKGKFYSMAMFTQANSQTKVDFRKYDVDNPTRRIPYILSEEIENKLTMLMNNVGLNSGSFDLIYSKQDEIYFLEVNPVGQFGMVSSPCNYNLEKEIAKQLMNF